MVMDSSLFVCFFFGGWGVEGRSMNKPTRCFISRRNGFGIQPLLERVISWFCGACCEGLPCCRPQRVWGMKGLDESVDTAIPADIASPGITNFKTYAGRTSYICFIFVEYAVRSHKNFERHGGRDVGQGFTCEIIQFKENRFRA